MHGDQHRVGPLAAVAVGDTQPDLDGHFVRVGVLDDRARGVVVIVVTVEVPRVGQRVLNARVGGRGAVEGDLRALVHGLVFAGVGRGRDVLDGDGEGVGGRCAVVVRRPEAHGDLVVVGVGERDGRAHSIVEGAVVVEVPFEGDRVARHVGSAAVEGDERALVDRLVIARSGDGRHVRHVDLQRVDVETGVIVGDPQRHNTRPAGAVGVVGVDVRDVLPGPVGVEVAVVVEVPLVGQDVVGAVVGPSPCEVDLHALIDVLVPAGRRHGVHVGDLDGVRGDHHATRAVVDAQRDVAVEIVRERVVDG